MTKSLATDALHGLTPAQVKRQLARFKKAQAASRRRRKTLTYTLDEVKAASDLAIRLISHPRWFKPSQPIS